MTRLAQILVSDFNGNFVSAKAYADNKIQPDLIPVAYKTTEGWGQLDRDEHPRPGTSLEGLADLKTPFRPNGRITADDVMGVIEGLVRRSAKEVLGLDVPLPLPRLSWDEAMERFGHDAPDLRYGLEIVEQVPV